MGAQVGVIDRCLKSLDGLAYTQYGRNLKTWWDFNDFDGGINNCMGKWTGSANGVGASITDNVGLATRPGQLLFNTGTTAAGWVAIWQGVGTVSVFLFGSGIYTFETDLNIVSLSTVAEEFIIRAGFGDYIAADAIDGAYFEYDRLTSVNWLRCTAINSVRTKIDTGIPVATGYLRLKIVVNADATAVEFFVNGISVGINVTNIPTGAGRGLSPAIHIVKSAGITQRIVYLDWTWIHYDLSVSR